MAGIGFSLQRILKHDSLARIAAAYTTAGIISGGPWIISIIGILILGILVAVIPRYHEAAIQFQISITYLVAFSLIASGFAQNSFSRYVADQLFLNHISAVIPNLNGMMLIVTVISGVLSYLAVLFLFPEQSILYRFFFMGGFVVLSNIWVITNLLTGLKDYTIILKAFFIAYSIIVIAAYLMRGLGLDAFMFSFLLGQVILLVILLFALYRQYPTNSAISFHFLKKGSMYKTLMLSGFLFNFAIWADKFVFWFYPDTSYHVLGPLRASQIYDVAFFLAYLALAPGMAVFLFLMETGFAEYYTRFNESIRNGKTLAYIQVMRDQMTANAFNVIYSIIKVQTITIVIVFQLGERMLKILNISTIYKNLLFIDVIGTSLQVVFLSILNLLYYMDRREDTLNLTIMFFVLNLTLSMLSIRFGPFYYGFGFTFSLIITCTYGMYLLNAEFTELEYKTIMLR